MSCLSYLVKYFSFRNYIKTGEKGKKNYLKCFLDFGLLVYYFI